MNCGGYELRIWAKEEKSINDLIALSIKNFAEHEAHESVGDYFTKFNCWKRLPDRNGSNYCLVTATWVPNDKKLYVANLSLCERHDILNALIDSVKSAVRSHPDVLAAEWEFSPDEMWDPGMSLFDTPYEAALFKCLGNASIEDFDVYLKGQ